MTDILVFGRTGQVARVLAARDDVRALDRGQADLSDPAACAAAIAAHSPAAVINAAAWTAVDAAEDHEAEARVINADAPTAMAQACAALDIPFVHISTDYVFDGSGDAPWRPGDACAPLQAYGRTKREGEEAILATGARAVILRTSWVFDGEGANFLTTMRRLGQTRDALNVVADQIGGPTPAAAIAEACVTIAAQLRGGTPGGLHHFSGTPDVSWADFARAIFAATGQDVTVTDIPTSAYPTPATRPLNSRLDCRDLERVFGITRPDWRGTVEAIVKEYP